MDSYEKLGEILARQHGAIRRSQAIEAGLTPAKLATLVKTSHWSRSDRGIYVSASAPPTWRRQLWAAYLGRPDALVTGRSAAHLLEFAGVPPTQPELLLPFTGNARSQLAHITRSRLFSLVGHHTIDGLRVTNVAETLLVLGYRNPPAHIERWIDELMADGRLSASHFDLIFARLANARVRGLPALRRIVMARDHDSYQPPTSQLERLLYRLLEDDTLPPSARQLPFVFETVHATVDAYIPSWRMVVEADGRRWHTRKADFDRDRARDNAAATRGIVVIRFTYRMLKSDPGACKRTLIEAGKWR